MVLARRQAVYQVDAGLVDSEDIRRGDDADVGNRRFGSPRTCTVAVNGHAAHDVDKHNMLAEIVYRSLRRVSHKLHKMFFCRPGPPIFRRRPCYTVNLPLADLSRRAADGDVLHRAAETAHGMAFEMCQDNHRIVIDDMAAHCDFFQMLTAADRQVNVAEFVHDIDRAESPAVDFQRFFMAFRRIAIAGVQRVRLYNSTVRNMSHKFLDHIPRQDIRAMLFTSMKLYGHLAVNALVNLVI